jgi:hypothetical protein
LHEQLAYVVPLGIPHSVFLSWEPLDQDKALAWQREQKKICPGCGTRPEQWDRDKTAFVGDIRHCWGCDTLDLERDNVRAMQEEGAVTRGLSVGLVPKEFAKSGAEAPGAQGG